jgi:hypothetical protein
MTHTIYAAIGNSDDKLSQQDWSRFVTEFISTLRAVADEIHGEWYSAPDAPYQNACCAFTIPDCFVPPLRCTLTNLRKRHGQDSIAWAEVARTDFI